MSDWIGLAVYVGGWLFTYRKIYVAIDDDEPLDDAFDRAMGTFAAALGALVWPAVLALALIHRTLRPTTRREREQRLAEREAAASEREREIRRMERELGIGGAK